MLNVKVLGSGCANCKTTAALIEQIAAELNVPIEIEKVEDYPTIAQYGVMATPGVVIEGKVVHAGGIPKRDAVQLWLKDVGSVTIAEKTSCGCGPSGCC